MMLIDSHCHLDFPDFEAQRGDVIARAQAAGVGAMVKMVVRLKILFNEKVIISRLKVSAFLRWMEKA